MGLKSVLRRLVEDTLKKKLLVILEDAFFRFDTSTANDTKRRLVDALRLLGHDIEWDPAKGVDAPAPRHIEAQATGQRCSCARCFF